MGNFSILSDFGEIENALLMDVFWVETMTGCG